MLLKWITATLFHIVISVYVDDVFIIETAEPIQSAIEIFKIVCDTIGFELETSTAHPPTAKIALLGSEISIEESRLTDKLPVRRSRGVINELRQIAQKNTLTPAHATETRGRLCFFAISFIWPGRTCPPIRLHQAPVFEIDKPILPARRPNQRNISMAGRNPFMPRADTKPPTHTPDASVRWIFGARAHR